MGSLSVRAAVAVAVFAVAAGQDGSGDDGGQSDSLVQCMADLEAVKQQTIEHSAEMILATGKNIPMDAGDYKLCKSPEVRDHALFFLLQGIGYLGDTGQAAPLKIGVCAPNSCTADDLLFLASMYLPEDMRVEDMRAHLVGVAVPWTISSILALFITLGLIGLCLLGWVLEYIPARPYRSAVTPGLSPLLKDGSPSSDGAGMRPINIKSRYKIRKFVEYFALGKNVGRLFSMPEGRQPTDCLNGMRVISMAWVIVGHTFFMPGAIAGYDNPMSVVSRSFGATRTIWMQMILGSELAVDTFFFLSAFLFGFHFLRHLDGLLRKYLACISPQQFTDDKGAHTAELINMTHDQLRAECRLQVHDASLYAFDGSGKDAQVDGDMESRPPRSAKQKSPLAMIPMLYLQRYLRLTPVMAFVMMFYYKLSVHMGSGPFWDGYVDSVFRRCDQSWWTQLLYIQNFYPTSSDDVCMGWSWYLGCDMVFYIMSPFIVIIFHKRAWTGWAILGALTTASSFVTWHLSVEKKCGIYIFDPVEYGDYTYWLYSKPWARIGPWLVGLGVAYLWHAHEPKITGILARSSSIPISILVAATAVLYFIVLIPTHSYAGNGNLGDGWESGGLTNTVYITFGHLVFGACVALVSIVCFVYPNNPVALFLGSPLWTPLARITYNAYLIHPVVIKTIAGGTYTLYHFDWIDLMYRTFGNIALSYLFAIVAYLLVEKPFMSLVDFRRR